VERIEYTLVRSGRKTLAIQIGEGGRVIVRAPQRLSVSYIDSFVESKRPWIEKHLQKPKPEVAALTAQQLDALTKEAGTVIPSKVAHYAKALDVSYGRITIRKQKTRWGSCSVKGNLSFNCLLLLAPERVLDYVVIHELCHRKEMNHSPQFWALVSRLCPGYKDCRKWLRQNGSSLIARLP